MSIDEVLQQARAILVAIDEGQLLAARPSAPDDAVRHEAAVTLLEIQRTLLEAT